MEILLGLARVDGREPALAGSGWRGDASERMTQGEGGQEASQAFVRGSSLGGGRSRRAEEAVGGDSGVKADRSAGRWRGLGSQIATEPGPVAGL